LSCKIPPGKPPVSHLHSANLTFEPFRRTTAVKLKEIVTVDGQTVVRGWQYLETGRRSRTGKPVTELHQSPTPWIPAETLLRHALVHHSCGGSGCGAARECPVHENCGESCHRLSQARFPFYCRQGLQRSGQLVIVCSIGKKTRPFDLTIICGFTEPGRHCQGVCKGRIEAG